MIAHVERAERERGLTLMELLVAMSLLAIAMTLITALFISLSQTFTSQEAQNDSTARAAVGMQQIGQAVRASAEVPQGTGTPLSAITTANVEALTTHAYFDPESSPLVPTRVTLAVNGDRELVETRVQARLSGETWVFDAAPRERVISRDLAVAGSELRGGSVPPLFTYVLGDGTELARALNTTERASAVAIEVSLTLETAARKADPVQIVRTIALPNLDVSTEAD